MIAAVSTLGWIGIGIAAWLVGSLIIGLLAARALGITMREGPRPERPEADR